MKARTAIIPATIAPETPNLDPAFASKLGGGGLADGYVGTGTTGTLVPLATGTPVPLPTG